MVTDLIDVLRINGIGIHTFPLTLDDGPGAPDDDAHTHIRPSVADQMSAHLNGIRQERPQLPLHAVSAVHISGLCSRSPSWCLSHFFLRAQPFLAS